MRKRWIAIAAAVSVLVCSGAYTYRVYATTDYDSKIKSIEEQKKSVEKKSQNLQETIDELETDKSDVLKYISKLDKQTKKINENLEKVEKEIEKISGKLKTAEKELEEAKKEEQSQYDTMKRRIKYMYENGSSEYMEIVFNADDIGDFLNRTEYIEKISNYDRAMLTRFQKKRVEIEKKEEEIQKKLDELKIKKDEVKTERDAVKKLNSNKKEELEKYKSSLKVTRAQKQAYEREVAKQEAAVERLLLQKQKEIEAEQRRREQERNRNRNNGNNSEENSGADDSGNTTDNYATAAGQYRWPLGIKGRISSKFGARTAPTVGASTYHKGIDIAVSAGTPILASNTGTVVTATYSSSAGNYLMIYHGNNTYTIYMHCSRLAVKSGASVIKGQVIAYVGSTGISTGPHLHFAFSVNGNYVDPLKYVKQ